MIDNQTPYKVLLPERILKEVNHIDHFKKLVLDYMRRYPHYAVIRVEKGFAVCARR